MTWWLQVINDVYRQANPGQSAIFFLNFALETDSYDVNVTPDKRTIMLHDESDIVQALKVFTYYQPPPPARGTPSLSLSLSHTHTNCTHTHTRTRTLAHALTHTHTPPRRPWKSSTASLSRTPTG